MNWISKISKSCFESKGYSYKKSNRGYTIYHTSNIFWIESRGKIGVCRDINELEEINKRLKLGLRNEK